MQDPKTLRLINIQLLRFFAAVLVCLFHFRHEIVYAWGDFLFQNGYVGVQLFFVISGVVMQHTTAGHVPEAKKTPAVFLIKRLVRILPLYYFATFLFIAHLIPGGFLATHGGALLHSLAFLPSLASTTGPAYGMPLLEVGWSLNYEMMFYLVFFVSLFFGKGRYVFLYTLFALAVVGIPLAMLGHVGFGYVPFRDYAVPYLNFFCNPILLLFIAGVFIGDISSRVRVTLPVARVLYFVSFAVFIAYYLFRRDSETDALYDTLVCGFLVFAFVLNDKMGQHPVKWPLAVRLGDASYSIYLLHPTLFSYFMLAYEKAGIPAGVPMFVLGVFLVLWASLLSYRYLETPVTRRLRKWIGV